MGTLRGEKLIELGALQAQLHLELGVERPRRQRVDSTLCGDSRHPGPWQGLGRRARPRCFERWLRVRGRDRALTLGRPQDKVQLLRLWYHESCRVFRDRLVNEEDRSWFDKLLESCMEQWEVAFEEVCPFQPILYGDFMSPGSDIKSYELITSKKKVKGPAGALPLTHNP